MESFVRSALRPIDDFQRTEILANGIVPADGTSPHVVVLHLKNSDNSAVPGYLPAYSVTGMLGVSGSPCTTSDQNGVSACLIKSVVPGAKSFRLLNAKVGLSTDIQFGAPAGFQRTSLGSASVMHAATAEGSKVQMTFGQPLRGVALKSAGGYQITFGIHGVAQ